MTIQISALTITTLAIMLTVFAVTILVWPRWMYLTRKVFLQRIYYALTPSLTYFQTKAIFENVFYCIFGVMAVLAISLGYQVSLTQIFRIDAEHGSIFVSVLRVFVEFVLLIAANSAAIFVWTGLLLPITNFRKTKGLDFSETWMETYVKLKPLAMVITIAFLPIFAEELFFRVLINSLLLNSSMIMNSVYIPVIGASISTLFFVIQQSIMLNNRTQMIAIGVSSFWIGIINSTAFILGASFYSILLSHYLFVIFMVVSMRSRRQQSLREFQ